MKRKFCTFLIGAALSAVLTIPALAAGTSTRPINCCRHSCCVTVCCCPQRPCPEEKPPVLPDVDDNIPAPPENNVPTPEPEAPILPEPEAPSLPEQKPSDSISQLEREAMELVNEKRSANGLAKLTLSAELSEKARIKSREMKQLNYFSHTSPTYGSPFDMMKALGIRYVSAGENIAMGYRTAQAVVNAWMNSPSHRENLLSSRYTTMGIGYEDGYWTQWFIS